MQQESELQPGLYVVATPIGNLQDITLRALSVLRRADYIFAEDTRVTGVLCQRHDIHTKLFSYREAAPRAVVARTIQEIAGYIGEGKVVAYVSDAGTPGVSDPGDYLVGEIASRNLPVIPIPGPSALAALLSVAGLAIQRPLFVGFLPRKKGRQTLMGKLQACIQDGVSDGLVFYESPERIQAFIKEISQWDINLELCLGRELTKKFETIVRGTPDEVLAALGAQVKGEVTVIVRPQRHESDRMDA